MFPMREFFLPLPRINIKTRTIPSCCTFFFLPPPPAEIWFFQFPSPLPPYRLWQPQFGLLCLEDSLGFSFPQIFGWVLFAQDPLIPPLFTVRVFPWFSVPLMDC